MTQPKRYVTWKRGPYYYEVRDSITGYCVDIRVGTGAQEAAEAEATKRNAEDLAVTR